MRCRPLPRWSCSCWRCGRQSKALIVTCDFDDTEKDPDVNVICSWCQTPSLRGFIEHWSATSRICHACIEALAVRVRDKERREPTPNFGRIDEMLGRERASRPSQVVTVVGGDCEVEVRHNPERSAYLNVFNWLP